MKRAKCEDVLARKGDKRTSGSMCAGGAEQVLAVTRQLPKRPTADDITPPCPQAYVQILNIVPKSESLQLPGRSCFDGLDWIGK